MTLHSNAAISEATALFLGRFQPPHVGHLLTIRSLARRYRKLIVGVTEAEPSVMPVPNVIGLLRQLLPDNRIEFIHVTGSVEGGTADIDVHFDICCSGNQAVLDIMKAKGFHTQFTERSYDHIYSGTQERESFVSEALKSSQQREASLSEFTLVPTHTLRPIEKIHPRHYRVIEEDLLQSGVMNKPLIVDRVTHAVLDGSHRYAFLLKHGYQHSPAVLCDYDDESIFVGTHLQQRFEYDASKWINKKHVRATSISGDLYEPRTTRHFFPFRKDDMPCELNQLTRGDAQSVDHLLFRTDLKDEIAKNDLYIDELEREMQTLKAYAAEQQEVQDWLKQQNAAILTLERKEPLE